MGSGIALLRLAKISAAALTASIAGSYRLSFFIGIGIFSYIRQLGNACFKAELAIEPALKFRECVEPESGSA